jgi:predicted transcriptional regulator
MYLNVLEVLERSDPLGLTHVMYETNVNCCVLKESLDFLMKQSLVIGRAIGKQRMTYSITQRGIAVLNYFRELKQVLPIVNEDINVLRASIQPEASGNVTT